MKLFLRQFRLELEKLFARKRTYLGFAAFLTVELIILSLLQLKSVQRAFAKLIEQNGYVFDHYFSGLTLAFLMLSSTIFFLGSLYLALVSGDMIAKEAEDGTLRMLLSRPVSRRRVLLIKYLACLVYTVSLMLFIVLTSVASGTAYKGIGGLFVFSPLQGVFGLYEAGPGLVRFIYAALALCVTTTTISTLGFMFSCFNLKPATATIMTLSLFFMDMVLSLIPYFESLRGYLVTYNMGVWIQFFQPHIPWLRIVESLVYLSAFNITFLTIGALCFCQRDFKS